MSHLSDLLSLNAQPPPAAGVVVTADDSAVILAAVFRAALGSPKKRLNTLRDICCAKPLANRPLGPKLSRPKFQFIDPEENTVAPLGAV